MAELANRVDLPLMNCRRRTRTTRMLTRFKRACIVESPLFLTGLRVQTVNDISRFLLVLFCPVVAHCVYKAVDNAERAHARPDIRLPNLGSRRCVELLESRLQIEMGTQVVGPILHLLRAHRNRRHQANRNATTPQITAINSLEPSHYILLLQDFVLPFYFSPPYPPKATVRFSRIEAEIAAARRRSTSASAGGLSAGARVSRAVRKRSA